MAKALIQTLLSLSLGGTLTAAALMLLRRLLGQRVPSGFWYAMWLLVLLRFALPVPGLLALPAALPPQAELRAEVPPTPEPTATPRPSPLPRPTGGMEGRAQTRAYAVERGASAALSPVRPPARPFSGWTIAMWVWCAGAAGSILWYLLGYLRFHRALLPTLQPAQEGTAAFWPCSRPLLRRSGAVYTPMLLGLLRPMVVLPERDFSPEMLRGILTHELAHYRRGDLALKWFTAALCSLHWFNPLMPLLRRELDRACELSCDALLLKNMDREEKQRYGELLLSLAAERPLPRRVVAVSLATEKRNLKERLVQIMTFKKQGKAAFALMLGAALLLAGCGAAAGPASGTEASVTPAPTPYVTPEPSMAPAFPELTPDPAPARQEETGTYTVHTVDEFLDALGSDRVIVVDAEELNLSRAGSYGHSGSSYTWEFTGDGYELEIQNARNLEIRAASGGGTSIVSEPRYANVLSFSGCDGVVLSGLTLGHTVEPGFCSGGVLNFAGSDNIRVEDCALYGCGTFGISASNCRALSAMNTSIYDCSYGAIEANGCWDLRFFDGEIHDCGRGGESYTCFDLLSARATTGFAVFNTAIYDNSTDVLFRCEYARGVEIRGCEISGNRINDGVFAIQGCQPLVDGCALADNTVSGEWYVPGPGSAGERPIAVDAAGKELEKDDFLKMELASYRGDYDGPEAAVPATPKVTQNAGGVAEYHAGTVDEFLASIGSDRVIWLDMEQLDLSKAADYGGSGGEFYYWRGEYDGPTLVISGAENLRIVGRGAEETVLEAHPRYAAVLSFYGCTGVSLENLTAGHTRGQGICSGDVLEFQYCQDCSVVDCGLFGCGVTGVNAGNCRGLSVSGTEIYACSYNAAVISGSTDTTFTGCVVRDCGNDAIMDYNGGVTIDAKTAETAVLQRYQ